MAKDCKKIKVEVGEIDTSSPFQSVRAAVSLFGEGSFSSGTTMKKPKPQPAERLLVRERQARLATKDLNKLKEQVENVEISKAQALLELEKAKRIVEDLSEKLEKINGSKDLPIHTSVAERFSGDDDKSKGSNGSMVTEVNVAKQELRENCSEYNASAETNEMPRKQGGTETCDDKGKQKQLYKARLKESAQNLLALKEDTDPEMTKNLEAQLDNLRAANLDSVKTVTMGLDGAKESLNKTAVEKRSLRSLVESLKLELDCVMKDHSEVQGKAIETELIASNLKAELEARGVFDNTGEAEELKGKVNAMRIELEEAEENLRVAPHEADEVKAAELRALGQIKVLSNRTNVVHAPMPEPGSLITVSRDEFESLNWKVEEFKNIADVRVAAAMVLIEEAKATEEEDLERLKALQKEIQDIKAATQEVSIKRKTSESAKTMVGGEFRRWQDRKQLKILEETKEPFQSSLKIYQILQQKPLQKEMESRKLATTKTSVAKKVLIPSLNSVCRKKSRV